MDCFGASTTVFTAPTAAAMEKFGGPTTQTRKKKVPLRKQFRFVGATFGSDRMMGRDGLLPSLINQGRRHGSLAVNFKPSPATPNSAAHTVAWAIVFLRSTTSRFATSAS